MEYKDENNGGGGGDDDNDFGKMQILWPFDKTFDHLVSGCPELGKTENFHRHNKAAAYIHRNICKGFGIELKERWYEHEPKTVTEKDSVTILWDAHVH